MAMQRVIRQHTPALGRRVTLREDTSDFQVWADTFTGLYHLPPDDMPTPATVLDVGANIGLTAAHYRQLWPEAWIVAVEMDAASANIARENAPGVVVRHHAVMGEWGLVRYAVDGVRAEAYSAEPVAPFMEPVPDTPPGFADVPANTLRQTILHAFGQFQGAHRARVDFVKLDVEGAEWEILATADEWAGLVGHILIELHPTGASLYPDDSEVLVERALGLLRAAGFAASRHEAHPRAVWGVR